MEIVVGSIKERGFSVEPTTSDNLGEEIYFESDVLHWTAAWYEPNLLESASVIECEREIEAYSKGISLVDILRGKERDCIVFQCKDVIGQ